MKKRFLSVLCVLALVLSLTGGALASEGDVRLDAIRVLGIMVGDETGDMALSRPVTRSEFVKMMTAASVYKDSVGSGYGASLFKDVKADHWAGAYIKLGVEQGWFNGYVDGTFRPDDPITLEEGCTALLRLLGYDASALAGSFPAAQLSKAESIGLLDGVSAARGQRLTRQDCVWLFYDLLTVQTSAGAVYGVTLGYTVTDGEVDYASLVAADLKGPFVVSDGGLELPFEGGTTYRDGVLSQRSAAERYDVYYYNANLKTVWIYTDRVIGTLSAVAPSRVSPASVTVAGQTYRLSTSYAVYQLSSQGGFADDEPVTLLLDLNGEVAEVLHGVHGELDEDEYSTVVNVDTKGPYVTRDGSLELPFDAESAQFYLNGSASAASAAVPYDVYYYNATLGVVWLYRDKVSGTLTGVAPSRVSPTSVTVAGTTYSIGTAAATRRLSSQGSFSDGDVVTLLLGMGGEVVEVLSAQESQGTYYGVVAESVQTASSLGGASSGAVVQTQTKVICTDGAARTFYHSGDTLDAGRLARVTVSNSGTQVTRLNSKTLAGAVNDAGTELGAYPLAKNVEIIDTDDDGNALRIYPSRLAGANLTSGDTRYYTLDDTGAIDRLILNDATGDLTQYAYVTDSDTVNQGMTISGTYRYWKDGQIHTVSGNKLFSVTTGGAALTYEEGAVKSMRQLASVTLTELSSLDAMAGDRRYALSENVQVFLKGEDEVYPTTLDEINAADYTLKGWYDSFGQAAGGRIRILLATPR